MTGRVYIIAAGMVLVLYSSYVLDKWLAMLMLGGMLVYFGMWARRD